MNANFHQILITREQAERITALLPYFGQAGNRQRPSIHSASRVLIENALARLEEQVNVQQHAKGN